MAMAWGAVVAAAVVVMMVSLLPGGVLGEIKSLSIKDDGRAIIPFGTFVFLPMDEVRVVVSNVEVKEAGADRSRMAFFLSTIEELALVIQDLEPVRSNLEAQGKNCLMDSTLSRPLFTLAETDTLSNYTHTVETSNEYSLFFENCAKTEISMDVVTSMYNVENGFEELLSTGKRRKKGVHTRSHDLATSSTKPKPVSTSAIKSKEEGKSTKKKKSLAEDEEDDDDDDDDGEDLDGFVVDDVEAEDEPEAADDEDEWTDEDEDEEEGEGDEKPLCKFGSKCFRKSKDHLAQFRH